MLLLATLVSSLALRPPPLGRRQACGTFVAAVSLPAHAYTLDLDAKITKSPAPIQPYLTAVASTKTATEFSDAVDLLVAWIIGQGEVPEGVDPRTIRDVLRVTYLALPQRAYGCEMTRTNKGVCYSPGEPADSSYDSALKQVRKYATRKGKGALMSDGVSAANGAAF
jgi:hypothetical protein